MDAVNRPNLSCQPFAEYPQLMTLHDAAARLHIEPRKLRVMVRYPDSDSRIVATMVNNVWRFQRDALAAYLLAYENQPQGCHDA